MTEVTGKKKQMQREMAGKKAGEKQSGTGAKAQRIEEKMKKAEEKKIRKEVKTQRTEERKPKIKEKGLKTEGKIKNKKTVEKTPARGTDWCPVAARCGGCQYLDISYEKQLSLKQRQVEKLLSGYCPVHKIEGMEHPFHYRNKVHAVFAHRRDGSVFSGAYEEGTHEVVPVETCLLENEKADEIIGSIRGLLKSFKIKIYNEDTGYGIFRHVLIRTAHQTGQIMVVLVVSSPVLPSKNNFVKALLALHPEITTVVLNVNDKRTSMILGEKETVLYGKGYIEDILCGCRFRISAKSFYQINSVQTEKLYAKAMELAGLSGKERVIDAYCGIGTIGLIAAKQAREVIGVELNRDAVRDAIRNAKANGAENIRFYQNDAGKFLVQMAEAGEKADVVIMDPPRSGSDEAFLASVVKLSPEKIVYISCNPETQARDLGYLTKRGYRAMGGWTYDLFPWTGHVETIVLLSHKSPDSVINVTVEFGESEGKVPLDAIEERAKKYQPKRKLHIK